MSATSPLVPYLAHAPTTSNNLKRKADSENTTRLPEPESNNRRAQIGVAPGQGYSLRKWKSEREPSTQEDTRRATTTQNHLLAESRRLAHETIVQLGRDPSGHLGDFDLFTTHSAMDNEFFGRFLMKEPSPDSGVLSTEAGADSGPPPRRLCFI
ncbi:hypothetical protein FRC11_008116 [Ceratobasidium sp. 423]|nr:hypothetical protein FRC11_008116 [Ceratobasidium sp. 423]